MSVLSETSQVVRLDVAGLGFDLCCDDEALARGLARRYQHYPPHSAERFQAEIRVQPGSDTPSLLQQPMNFIDGILIWDVPGCQGSIDPFQRRGNLELFSNQPLAEAEYYLRAACAILAFETGGLMFHAAGIVRKGGAQVFFGRSGSGKSTVARLSAGHPVLNDDLLCLASSQGRWWVHSTPFWNMPVEAAPVAPASLAGLYRLVQDTQAYLQPLQGAPAVAELLASAPVISADPGRSAALIQRCQAILAQTPAYHLHFLPDGSLWRVIDNK